MRSTLPPKSVPPPRPGLSRADALAERYRSVRRRTEALCAPLSAEDMVVQSMPDASPVKWHLAHTTWFFETFVLARKEPRFSPFHPQYGYLFNSYYDAVGPRHARPRRGLLSRPPLSEIRGYREQVDARLEALIPALDVEGEAVLEIGLHHEEQHQELLLTDIKHAFFSNPMRPAYAAPLPVGGRRAPALSFVTFEGGVYEIGHGGDGFAFDNERPRHRVFLEPFALANRTVTCGEYLAFVDDGGYRRSELWLSDGFAAVQGKGWDAPLYWERGRDGFTVFTLHGSRPIDLEEPVAHVSYYEADAYARWAGARCPTEQEWEVAAMGGPIEGGFADCGRFHPAVAGVSVSPLAELFGSVWEWTQSAFAPYPHFRPAAGALGEYNSKFMCNQFVLRGGSCATPAGHVRASYRNFFYPDTRWQFAGLRLAKWGT
ncbi:MAG TPA: ergothioneine biosynthesis protein EgtB [Anaeromyxobacteraceae bacterium]|nr:ergothioneine biosynthesis protein EgtB [Anaeromyxobacteraceae bacterium]